MKLAIVFGGESFEHEISIVSAIALKKVVFSELLYIFCDKNRDFYLIPTELINSKRFSSGKYLSDAKLTLKQGGFYYKKLFKEEKVNFDCAINIIHGGDGEDGKIAALFDFFGVPYIGPNIEASVLSYNKFFTKLYAKAVGVKTLDYEVVNKNNKNISLPLPVIIKPLRLGSSIGVSVVKEQKELEYALDVAFEFDDEVLVEPFIENVAEYNIAGCKIGGTIRYSIIEEPQKELILDFDKKYLDFSRTAKVYEARLTEIRHEEIRKNFKLIYEPLFEGAIIRCDFFLIKNSIYLNEINPNPGSLANYLFEEFNSLVQDLARNLPKRRKIAVEYKYINSIQSAKGKA
ncbi:MAG: D-alanine--D-alanine ligase [Campylobacteraceae bacterium]|jgi:D-alanine-D-alanine ligase|nr:D-alanine--D-alanine ligase [Campylobacteraceae bacterium]